MELKPKADTIKGPADWFTGDVWLDPIADGVNAVRFSPGARTAWHAHSDGQMLFVTEGRGLAQSRGEPIVTIRPGDRVFTPPAEWHWHGADHDHFMSHLSITHGDATWGEHVTDDEYRGT